jgi:hypothetical protein
MDSLELGAKSSPKAFPSWPNIGSLIGLLEPMPVAHDAFAAAVAKIRLAIASMVNAPRDNRRHTAIWPENPAPIFFVIRFIVFLLFFVLGERRGAECATSP